MKQMNMKIKAAADVSQRAQRNWDQEKIIPEEDLETILYAAKEAATKQNEINYSIYCFTDRDKIKQIYDCTKKFTAFPQDMVKGEVDVDKDPRLGEMFKDIDGQFWQDDSYSVKNSQISGNALFVYCANTTNQLQQPMSKPLEMKLQGRMGGTHLMATKATASPNVISIYKEQIDFSIGISAGQLVLSAALLGYKTGFCSAFLDEEIEDILGIVHEDGSHWNPKLLVSCGFPGDRPRSEHQDLLNDDMMESARTGELGEKYMFPSFDKEGTPLYLNGVKIQ